MFFFDDPAAGNRLIAKGMRARGALVYFEPSKVSGNAELDAINASDIIKFSDENVPDVSFADDFRDKVFIQTRAQVPLSTISSTPAIAFPLFLPLSAFWQVRMHLKTALSHCFFSMFRWDPGSL